MRKLFPDSRAEILITRLINQAEELGLSAQDVSNAGEMTEYNEWEVVFDIVVSQLYEYSVPVTKEFCELAAEIISEMKIDPQKYAFIDELVELVELKK